MIDGIAHIAMAIGQRTAGSRRWFARCSGIENTYLFKANYPTCVRCLGLANGYQHEV